MKGKFTIAVGFLVVLEIIYKLTRCASCDATYFGFEMSGYTYLIIHTLLASFLIYSGYRLIKKSKEAGNN